MREPEDPAGWALLTSPAVGDLLKAAVRHRGGRLRAWRVAEVDASPGLQTTATYLTTVEWPFGTRDEVLGVSARAGGAAGTDADAEIFAAGDRQVAVWLYPRDPDLPGLARAAFPAGMAAVLTEHGLLGGPVRPEQVDVTMIGYRPRRRAVLRARVTAATGTRVFYVKALTLDAVVQTARRHEMLLSAGLPVPAVLATSEDQLIVLPALPGRPLADAVFDPEPPCTAEALLGLLDALPPEAAALPLRVAWSSAVGQYAETISTAMPDLRARLEWLVDQVVTGLSGQDLTADATHGDFHEGQVFVAGGTPVGLLDVDRLGPGRRADDLACLLAHLSTIQQMSQEQSGRVSRLIRQWREVFDDRVDPIELRLRSAAVTVSLATGPYRTQRVGWQQETLAMVETAERMIVSIG